MATKKKIIKKKVVKKKAAKKRVTKKRTTRKKSKTKKASTKDEILYMGISNPVEIRKTILENARDMVQFLQLFEKFRIIREEKSEATKILKKEVKQLNILVNKLKKALPKTSIRARKEAEEEIKEAEEDFFETEEPEVPKTKKKSQKVELPNIEADDIEALEIELREIEDKLNFL